MNKRKFEYFLFANRFVLLTCMIINIILSFVASETANPVSHAIVLATSIIGVPASLIFTFCDGLGLGRQHAAN